MFSIDSTDNTIKLTRGDTARFSIDITNDITESDYTFSKDDTLKFTVKKRVKDEASLISKTSIGTTLFHIKPEDTNGMAFGKYVYDVQLSTADGDVYTIIGPATFELLTEVTY